MEDPGVLGLTGGVEVSRSLWLQGLALAQQDQAVAFWDLLSAGDIYSAPSQAQKRKVRNVPETTTESKAKQSKTEPIGIASL